MILTNLNLAVARLHKYVDMYLYGWMMMIRAWSSFFCIIIVVDDVVVYRHFPHCAWCSNEDDDPKCIQKIQWRTWWKRCIKLNGKLLRKWLCVSATQLAYQILLHFLISVCHFLYRPVYMYVAMLFFSLLACYCWRFYETKKVAIDWALLPANNDTTSWKILLELEGIYLDALPVYSTALYTFS